VLFSVIIPVYNNEKFLSSCIDSVRNQTFTDWELHLIDDGSTDGSGQICDAAARQDERIHVTHQPNGGVSRARNCGLAQSRGDYVVFIDADDTITPDLLEKLAQKSVDHPDIMLINIMKRTGNGKTSDFGWKLSARDSDEWIYRLLLAGFLRESPRKICRRELFSHAQFPEGYITGEDLYICADLALHARRFAVVEKSCYYYNKAPHGSATERSDARKALCDFGAWKHLLDKAGVQSCSSEAGRRQLQSIYESACTWYALEFLQAQAAGDEAESDSAVMAWLRQKQIPIETRADRNLGIEKSRLSFYMHSTEFLGKLSPLWAERAARTAIRLYVMDAVHPSLSHEMRQTIWRMIDRWQHMGASLRMGHRVQLWLLKHGISAGISSKGKKLINR
jgi:hypothetical protein